MSAQLKQQIAGLQRKLNKLEVNGSNNQAASSSSKKRKRRRNRAGNPASNNAGGSYVAPMAQNPNPRKAGGGMSFASRAGEVTLSRTEFVTEVKGGSYFFNLHPDFCSFMKRMSALFDRISWRRAIVHWKPAVGTTEAGLIAYGMDWDSMAVANVTKEYVTALTPVAENPVWQMSTLTLPPNRLMTRKEYRIINAPTNEQVFEAQPGALCYSCSGDKTKVMGEFWLTYTVVFFGTST